MSICAFDYASCPDVSSCAFDHIPECHMCSSCMADVSSCAPDVHLTSVPDVSMYTGLDYPLYCRVYCTLDCKLNCTIYWTLDCLPDDVHGPGLHIGLSGRLYTVLYHILDTGLYLMVYNRLYAGPHSVHWTGPYTVHRTRLHSTLDVQYTVYSGCPLACTQLKEVPS